MLGEESSKTRAVECRLAHFLGRVHPPIVAFLPSPPFDNMHARDAITAKRLCYSLPTLFSNLMTTEVLTRIKLASSWK